jgi:protocatechuate 3,4-dioxygenase beta subunit
MSIAHHPHDDLHDRGLAFDLATLMERRRVLGLLGATGAGALLAACDYLGPAANSEANQTAAAADGVSCIKLPAETNGPFPADGTNSKAGATVNVLTQSGIIRPDMRTSFAGMTPVAVGAQLDLTITLVNVGKGCAPSAGHVVYLWHCDVDGNYSLYDTPDRNYLRGAAITDANGQMKITTVFPGCYPGRWPHIHFEVFANAQNAANGKASLLVSQFALPGDVARALYAADKVYASSVANLAASPLKNDMVFADNTPEQLAAQTLRVSGGAGSVMQGTGVVGIVAA